MLNEITQDATERMQKSVESLVNNFKKIRTGRAHPSILEGVQVSYYGSDVPLSQVETSDRRLSAQWEHTILVTADGYEILTLRPDDSI